MSRVKGDGGTSSLDPKYRPEDGPEVMSGEPEVLNESGLENAAIVLMEMRGGPGEPMRDEARAAIQAYLTFAPASPEGVENDS